MPSTFISSPAEARYPGAFALETAPPRQIAGVSSGYIGLVGQFDWGPSQQVVTVESPAHFLNTFAPAGSSRASTGYWALMKRKKLVLKIVRVLSSDAVPASKTDAGTGGNLVSTAKYPGTMGNSITRTIAAATDGDTAKRDLTYTLTNAVTGTTVEVYRNVSLNVSPDVSQSKLLASIAFSGGTMTVWPANGTANLASGSNGSAIVATDYTGTLGSADKGVALFEAHSDVRVVCHDDCGAGIRATVNTGFIAHAADRGDRLALLEGDQNASWSTVKGLMTGSLVTDRCIFTGAWVKVLDDAGVKQITPMSTFLASVLVNFLPMESHAWWDDKITDFYAGIEEIYAPFATDSATIKAEATEKGICLPVQLASGRFAALHDRTTNQTTGKLFAIRRRITDFLAVSILRNIPSFVNGPNVSEQQRLLKSQVDTFLSSQVKAGVLVSFSTDILTVNDSASIAAGGFAIGIDAKTPSIMERILLLLNAGETVTVREAA